MLPLNIETNDRREYLIDMIEQLADFARDIGEIEMAIHLDATAEAARHGLKSKNET